MLPSLDSLKYFVLDLHPVTSLSLILRQLPPRPSFCVVAEFQELSARSVRGQY